MLWRRGWTRLARGTVRRVDLRSARPGTAPLSAPAMWTPSAGTRCGVAQYAEALVAALHRTGCPVTHVAEPINGGRRCAAPAARALARRTGAGRGGGGPRAGGRRAVRRHRAHGAWAGRRLGRRGRGARRALGRRRGAAARAVARAARRADPARLPDLVPAAQGPPRPGGRDVRVPRAAQGPRHAPRGGRGRRGRRAAADRLHPRRVGGRVARRAGPDRAGAPGRGVPGRGGDRPAARGRGRRAGVPLRPAAVRRGQRRGAGRARQRRAGAHHADDLVLRPARRHPADRRPGRRDRPAARRHGIARRADHRGAAALPRPQLGPRGPAAHRPLRLARSDCRSRS